MEGNHALDLRLGGLPIGHLGNGLLDSVDPLELNHMPSFISEVL